MTKQQTNGGTLGTFAGVFTPSVLTILGIILFLRVGFVVGNAGLTKTYIIIAISTAVSVVTSLSLAAIATNIEVRGGGDYYLISRTLGVEFGGAIGIVLFLAQSVSVAFYTIGFAEAVMSLLSIDSRFAIQAAALVAVGLLFMLAWAGADVATKFQFVVMAILVLALGSFYVGAFGTEAAFFESNASSPAGSLGFWAVFAIFFPAVTGFTQGVSMSGELRNAGKSLPLGTFVAVGVSTVVYASVAWLIAGNAMQSDLIADGGEALRSISAFGPLVSLGVVAATLSSAMASFLGAPRILQSLASDRIFPILTPFAKTHGPTGNPRRGVLLTLAIAVLTVGLGSVNLIAPVVSMFFLISYGLLNYATYFEARAASPAFRPRFRFYSKGLSLAGAIGCLGVMIAINAVAGTAALVIMYGIYRYLAIRGGPDRWADAAHSHYFQRAKESIRALGSELEHPRNWRPQIVTFSGDPVRGLRLIQLGEWLGGDSGVSAAFRIIEGDGIQKRTEAAEAQRELDAQIDEYGIDVHGRVVLAPDVMESLPVIIQSFGVGKIRANTVLFGWPESVDEYRRVMLRKAMRDMARLGIHVVSASTDDVRWTDVESAPTKGRRVDVWWNDTDSARLGLLMAYLLTRTRDWNKCAIRLVVPDGLTSGDESIAEMLERARISAEVVTLYELTHDALVEAMADSTLILMPMRVRNEAVIDPLGGDMNELIPRLPMTAGLLAGAPVHLVAGPESGTLGELAEAEEALEDAEARVTALERRLKDAESEIAALRIEMARPEGLADAQERLEHVEVQRAETARRAAVARTKVEAARARVESLLTR